VDGILRVWDVVKVFQIWQILFWHLFESETFEKFDKVFRPFVWLTINPGPKKNRFYFYVDKYLSLSKDKVKSYLFIFLYTCFEKTWFPFAYKYISQKLITKSLFSLMLSAFNAFVT
jgi:hypothetical protein